MVRRFREIKLVNVRSAVYEKTFCVQNDPCIKLLVYEMTASQLVSYSCFIYKYPYVSISPSMSANNQPTNFQSNSYHSHQIQKFCLMTI